VERLRHEAPDATLVWAPRGPWDEDAVHEVATRLDLVLAFDPSVDARPPGEVVYARMTALGATRAFSDAALESALDTILEQTVTRGFVAIDSDRSFKLAQRMQALCDTAIAER
jgi:hypothetical protein